ncbi:MAG: amidohydrolase family protein, partial [Erysipelotrichaceae bacterium]|nr:amidohydrolase family protein [Erysipelotrichaceae bacterium]
MKTAYINGQVYTITSGFKEAFVVDNEKFSYVGNSVEASQLADEIVDLKGQFVTCGFNDSHMHLVGFGGTLENMNLASHTSSLKELLAYIKDYIAKNAIEPGTFVKGRGWNHDYFSDVSRFVTRDDLDGVSKEIPIVITRACGHVCVVNSKALQIIGIDESTQPLEGGSFDLEAGLFRESCLSLVYDYINKVTVEDLKRYIQKASRELNSYGITSVQTDDYETYNCSYKDVVKAYKELEQEEEQ